MFTPRFSIVSAVLRTATALGVFASAAILTAEPLVQPSVILSPGGVIDAEIQGGQFGRTLALTPKFLHVSQHKYDEGLAFQYALKGFVQGPDFGPGLSAGLVQDFGQVMSAGKKHLAIGVTSIEGVQILPLSDPTVEPLTISNPKVQSDKFGAAVSMMGTGIAIGAPNDAAIGLPGSAFFVDVRNPADVTEIINPSPAGLARYGEAVALGKKYIAVSAPDKTVSGRANEGEVYLFNAKTRQHVRTIVSRYSQAGQRFGAAMAMYGNTLVVGSPDYDFNVFTLKYTDAGIAQIFQLDHEEIPSRLLFSDSVTTGSQFGKAVALNKSTVVIGAPRTPAESLDRAGVVNAFDVKTGTRTFSSRSLHPTASGNYGTDVAITKKGQIIVGAPDETGHHHTGYVVGNVYVY